MVFGDVTPSLPHSLAPSLPHSLTPSLPHSLTLPCPLLDGAGGHNIVLRADGGGESRHPRRGAPHGKAVQIDPIKPKLKLPRTKRLKAKCDDPLLTFAFKLKLRRCMMVDLEKDVRDQAFKCIETFTVGPATWCPPRHRHAI